MYRKIVKRPEDYCTTKRASGVELWGSETPPRDASQDCRHLRRVEEGSCQPSRMRDTQSWEVDVELDFMGTTVCGATVPYVGDRPDGVGGGGWSLSLGRAYKQATSK